MAGHPARQPAERALTAGQHRIALPGDVRVPVLRRSWREVFTGLDPGELGVVRWAEDDRELYESAARELTGVGPNGVRGTVLSTGSRTALHVCADPGRLSVDRLGELLREVATTYQAASAGRLTLRPDPPARQPAQSPGPAATGPPELVVLRDAGRPHIHLHYPGIGAGGAYRLLAAALPAHWTITALDDQPAVPDIETAADHYLAALSGRFATPDLLGGWSLGGLIGLAAVRRYPTRRPGLFLADSPPPDLLGGGRPPDEVAAFAEFLWGSFQLDRYRPVELDTWDDELGLRLLGVALRHAGEDVPLPWLTDWLAQYRRQLGLLAGYTVADRTDVPALLLLGSLNESEVDTWRKVIGPGLDVRRLGGGHFDLLRVPLVVEAARALAALGEVCHAQG